MSPRSDEFMTKAREMLAVARHELDGGFASRAISSAYYAMLNAARAALSEEDLYAKTHSGTWTLFSKTFVRTRRFDATLAAAARDGQEEREASDYGFAPVDPAEAAELIATAERFLAAVETLTA